MLSKNVDEMETNESGCKVLEVDTQSGFDSSSSGDDTSTFQSSLNGTKRVVKRTFHLVEQEI